MTEEAKDILDQQIRAAWCSFEGENIRDSNFKVRDGHRAIFKAGMKEIADHIYLNPSEPFYHPDRWQDFLKGKGIK